MPAMTPEEYEKNFRSEAAKLVRADLIEGFSHNNLIGDVSRKKHAKAFSQIVKGFIHLTMRNEKAAKALLELYELTDINLDEPTALARICQFESDIGFLAPALAECVGASSSSSTRTFLQLFEPGNPFPGPLEQGKYATHTWDIVGLLGSFEDEHSPDYQPVIRAWRERIIAFVARGPDGAGLREWKSAGMSHDMAEIALVVDAEKNDGMRYLEGDAYIGPATRRGRLLDIATQIHPTDEADVLWNDVCRRFLMKGE
ncbi:hypothetical protein QFC19_008605 [Naganishia cerealis]|uniref:Uncharacterized protein n=1 Tax=Naganishia cerealis TaxID=610337 RepID=A0ACC2V087_9TREE|nr:hypothetical protein QFC19_008605 [Naganishia cerealis]